MNQAASRRRAAISALLAIPAVILAVVFAALFFGGTGEIFGPLNDLAVAASAAFLVLPVYALVGLVRDDGGGPIRWFAVLCLAAIVGLVAIAAIQALVAFELVSLEASFAVGSIGLLPVLAWAVGLGWLSLRRGIPDGDIGWALVALLGAAAIVTVVASVATGAIVWLTTALLLAAFAWLLLALARALLAGEAIVEAGRSSPRIPAVDSAGGGSSFR